MGEAVSVLVERARPRRRIERKTEPPLGPRKCVLDEHAGSRSGRRRRRRSLEHLAGITLALHEQYAASGVAGQANNRERVPVWAASRPEAPERVGVRPKVEAVEERLIPVFGV